MIGFSNRMALSSYSRKVIYTSHQFYDSVRLIGFDILPSLLPSQDATFQLYQLLEAGFVEELCCIMTTLATATIEGNRTVFLELSLSLLDESFWVGAIVNHHSIGDVASLELFRRADIEQLHFGLGDELRKLINGDDGHAIGCRLTCAKQECE